MTRRPRTTRAWSRSQAELAKVRDSYERAVAGTEPAGTDPPATRAPAAESAADSAEPPPRGRDLDRIGPAGGARIQRDPPPTPDRTRVRSWPPQS